MAKIKVEIEMDDRIYAAALAMVQDRKDRCERKKKATIGSLFEILAAEQTCNDPHTLDSKVENLLFECIADNIQTKIKERAIEQYNEEIAEIAANYNSETPAFEDEDNSRG